MTDASAYILEDIQRKLEEAKSHLSEYLRKSSRAISAKKNLEDYEKVLAGALSILEKTVDEYPEDEELSKINRRLNAFYNKRKNVDHSDHKENVSNIISDLKSLAHWRKMETAYGRTLGFSDFRSLRGKVEKR